MLILTYLLMIKINLIKSMFRVRVRVYCWCRLRDFFLLLYSSVVWKWIGPVNYNHPPRFLLRARYRVTHNNASAYWANGLL